MVVVVVVIAELERNGYDSDSGAKSDNHEWPVDTIEDERDCSRVFP